MKLLALESSAKAASVAICEDDRLIAQYFQNSGLTHSRTLLAMADDMLKNLEITMADIDAVAVAKGPGSFTGVRIGVSAAKGLAWGAGIPIYGVSTLEAMAHLCCRDDVVICPVMDARRSQVYNALFAVSNGGISRLCEDRAIAIAQLISEANSSEKPFFLIGDGAELCYNEMTKAGCNVMIAPAFMRFQTAAGVAIAARSSEPTTPDKLEPNYLRLSQAERERLERMAAENN